MGALHALVAGLTAVAFGGAPAQATQERPVAQTQTLGQSVDGRPVRAYRVGAANAPVALLVVGSIHGTEQGGKAIVARLRTLKPRRGTAIWLVDDANPDGTAAGRRQNAHGVDLNRNFPYRWAAGGRPFDTYYPGSGPASEPETQALSAFVERVRPRVTIWYHQALNQIVQAAGDPKLEKLYSARSGLPRKPYEGLHGTATDWQNATYAGDTAFVAELPGGRPSEATIARNAAAVKAVAAAVAPPRVVSKPIPFGADRREQMRAYAQRHYGLDTAALRDPKVIVEHYTATSTFAPVFNTFASNAPDVELGELPGVCSHYVIDRDGTVYQLVPTTLMCRHTVGLNWTSIGIEHVGQSDADVLRNPAQLRASLRLTRMLQGRYGIATKNVIGHAESLSSPYHRERVARLRTQTHGDLPKVAMDGYRRRLGALPAPASLR